MTSRASKILRRTASGGSLALIVGLGMWWASKSPDYRPVLWITSLALFGAIWEVARMGALRGRVTDLVLLAPAGVVILLQDAASRAALDPEGLREAATRDPAVRTWEHVPDLAVDYGSALLVCVLVFGLLRCLLRLRIDVLATRFVLCLTLGGLFFLVFRDYALVRYWLLVSVLPISLVALSTLPVVLRERGGLLDLGISAGLALWLVVPLPNLWRIAHEWGIAGLIALLVLSKIGDTAGYYVGSAIGKHHPFKRLSPGKTTEGCLGSLAAGTLAGTLLAHFGVLPTEPWGIWGGALIGAVTNIAAQSGDLLESWVKRRAGVKDSSTVFGPSGGVLDQLDSLLVSVPVAILVWPWIFAPATVATG